MAVLNELGRNSSAITYQYIAGGSELYPTFATVDKWLRNDTLQGTATASGVNVTGTNNTIFNTQVRAGDSIMIAGQLRIVQTVSSDTSFSVTQAFSPAITNNSSIKVISYTLAGTANNVTASYPNFINGTVSVTNDANGAIVTGIGTYFLSDLTNQSTVSAMTGTVAVATTGQITGTGTAFSTGAPSANSLQPGDGVQIGTSYFVISATDNTGAAYTITDSLAWVTVPPASAITSGASISKAANGVVGTLGQGRTIVINGRVRQIVSIASNTVLTVNAPFDFTDSNLKVKAYPRGTIAVVGGTTTVTGTGTNFYWDLPPVSQVWIGDELRSFSYTTTTAGSVGDPTGYSGTAMSGTIKQTVNGIPFRKDDSYLTYVTGAGTVLSAEIRVGDDLIINGTECTVTQIISDTQFRVGQDLPLIPALSTVYKKKKIHGYVLEGTREGLDGTYTQTKFSNATYILQTAFAGATSIVVNTAPGLGANNFIKIQNAGGPPILLSGGVAVSGSGSVVTAVTGTKFLTELYIGAEVCVAGIYATVTAIDSLGATFTCSGTTFPVITGNTPVYRTVPLYTQIVSGTTTLTLATPIRNTIVISSLVPASSPAVTTPAASVADFIEFVYSAPNKSAEATVALTNQSLDRKYFGFRFYPLASAQATYGATLGAAKGAYNLVVYERWVGSWAQTGGVGINKADASANTTAVGDTAQTVKTIDQTVMSMDQGGFLYLFAKPRYFIIQGKSFSNFAQPWLGCVEFERAQPEDVGSGLGTTATGVTWYTGTTTAAGIAGTPTVSPWPCFAYFHANRFPVGSMQTVTLPIPSPAGIPFHGGIFSVPRIHASTGDLVGVNAHVYTAATITTGRWGHTYEQPAIGGHTLPVISGAVLQNTVGIPQPHLGQLVPIASNVYNSKRFMFSPVVVLGPMYDPDIRGRMFGLKIIPSALGSLMDTVSVTVDSVNDFYDSTAAATDHWVITSPGTSNQGVQTYRFTQVTSGFTVGAQYRSLEDTATGVATITTFNNNFRFAIPA